MRFFWVTLFVLLYGCAHRQKSGYSLQHDGDSFTKERTAFPWVKVTEEQYAKSDKIKGERYFPQSHPTTQHISRLLDILWQAMVKVDPFVALAPHPEVRIRDASHHDAFVSAQTVCLKVPLRIPERIPPGDLSGSWLAYDRGYATGLSALPEAPACVTVESSLTQLQGMMAWLLADQKDCEPLKLQQYFEFSPQCRALDYVKEGLYDGLVTKLTHQIITIDRSLLKGMTELQVIAVLAHELGHYAMAHRTARPEEYGYFYKVPSHQDGTKPRPIPADHPVQETMRKVQTGTPPSFVAISGQKIHGSVLRSLVSVGRRLSDASVVNGCVVPSPDCQSACVKLGQNLGKNSSFLVSYGTQDTPASDPKLILGLEQDLEICGRDLKASFLAMEITRSLDQIFGFKVSFTAVPKDGTLWSFISLLSEKAKTIADAQNQEWMDAVRTAYKEGIGLYTIEQEADDFATDLVKRVGLPANTVMEMIFKLAELQQKPGISACREALEKGFPSFISPGQYVDTHHDFCFRAYNSFLELKRHKGLDHQGSLTEMKVTLLPQQEWESLVKKLSATR